MSLHHVLGVLEDHEDRLWATLDLAVRLADSEHAQLTLAKTTDPGRMARWLASCAVWSLCLPSVDIDLQTIASHRLARAAEFVPASIPIATLLLGLNTRSALVKLLCSDAYDALVATDELLAHSPRLGRELRRVGVRVVPVSHRPGSSTSPLEMIGASS